MNWNERMQTWRDSQSVAVMALLSAAAARKICFSPLAAIVLLLVARNVDGVWSTFMMSSSGMLSWRTLSVISWTNFDLTSAQRDPVINCATSKIHPLVQWSNPWSCHFKIPMLAKSFWVCAKLFQIFWSTSAVTCLLLFVKERKDYK